VPGESKFQKKVINHLKSGGPDIWHFKTIASNRNGIADIIGCKKKTWYKRTFGQLFAVECKDPENPSQTHTKLQSYELSKVAAAGGKIFKVERHHTLQDVIDFIAAI
jgi:hypothetical protein